MTEQEFADFRKYDIGDIIGVSGYVFKTKTEEISVHVEAVTLLSKSLRPLPLAVRKNIIRLLLTCHIHIRTCEGCKYACRVVSGKAVHKTV